MISIIICSRNPKIDKTLNENIKQTIGVEYEIIHIDNSEGKYGICGAYNEGVRQSKGDILCFMHEDILFHSADWGKKIEKYFGNQELGMLGVSGSIVVPDKYDWRFFGFSKTHVVQGYSVLTYPLHYYIKGIEWNICTSKERVAIVDGCWFCIRKSLFDKGIIRFDEDTFKGFHLYDSDISMQLNKSGFRIYICSDIVIEHFSEGNYTVEFHKALDAFLKKWEKELPFSVEKINPFLWGETEKRAEGKLENRIEKDKIRAQIVKAYAKNNGLGYMPLLPKGAEKIIEESVYNFTKDTIKYAATNKEAHNSLAIYKKMEYKPRMWKLMMKFCYYRFINKKHSMKIEHIHSLRK